MVSTYLMKSIYKKIKLSPFFLLIIFISLISGLFKDVITLFMIIIIHELGHIILSYLFKWNIKSVEIGVFGGFITVNHARRTMTYFCHYLSYIFTHDK